MTQDPAGRRPQFRSDLGQTPLAEVLATVYRYRVPGIIECTRGEEIKRIYIDAGTIIFATSTNTVDSLGDRLLKAGRITRQQYDESVQRIGEGGKRQGSILVEMRALQPKALFVAVREQVQAIVWSIFPWEEGKVTFRPGRDKHLEFIKLEIPIPRAVLEGVAHSEARSLIARLGSRATVFEQNPDAEKDDLKVLTAEEKAFLHEIDCKRALSDLTRLAPRSASDNARLLYAFSVLRLIRVKAPKQIKVHIRSSKS
jgi:hypothetical protein